MHLIENIPYRGGHPLNQLDVILPDGDGVFPVVLAIHGGGWYCEDKVELRKFCAQLAAKNIASVLPNYRLTGTHCHPAQEQDVFAALDWVTENAREYKLDANRIGLTGCSAGGHLAALLGLKATLQSESHRRALRCMFLICGVYDIAQWAKDVPQYHDLIKAFLGKPIEQAPSIARDASPITFVHRDAPVSLCVHGDKDITVPINQSILLADALRHAGAKAELIAVPNRGHTAYHVEGSEEIIGTEKVFVQFFQKHLAAC